MGENQGARLPFTANLRSQVAYSFAVTGETAPLGSTSSADNTSVSSAGTILAHTFALQLLNGKSRVMEASFKVPAADLVSFGAVQAPKLLWYPTPRPGITVWVTMSVRIPRRAPPGLRALRFTMPEGLRHGVKLTTKSGARFGVSLAWAPVMEKTVIPGTFGDYLAWTLADTSQGGSDSARLPTSVNESEDVSLGAALPVVADERKWLDLGRRDEVEIRFEPRRSFPACEIMVQFSVHLPNTMPAQNAWRLTLVLETGAPPGFVVPGFFFDESPDVALEKHAVHVFHDNGRDYRAFLTEEVSAAIGLGTIGSRHIQLLSSLLLGARTLMSH